MWSRIIIIINAILELLEQGISLLLRRLVRAVYALHLSSSETLLPFHFRRSDSGHAYLSRFLTSIHSDRRTLRNQGIPLAGLIIGGAKSAMVDSLWCNMS